MNYVVVIVQNEEWAFKRACLSPNNEFKWGINKYGAIMYGIAWFQYIVALGLNTALLRKITKSTGASQNHIGHSNVCLPFSNHNIQFPVFNFNISIAFSSMLQTKDI